ncbi:MAG: terminase gpA endonuclease subunit [Terriglobales bacterium]
MTLIDSGAHADSVYDYVLPRQHTRRRIFACKGVDYLSKPGLVSEGTTKRTNIRLWTVATYAAKDRVLARMKIPKPGPGYMHLPDWATEEYLEQLTGEKKITVRDRRTRTRKPLYVKTYTRNEALDLTVYCHAGLFILQYFIEPSTYRDLGRLAALVQQGHAPGSLVPLRMRRVRSPGLA